MSNEVVLIETRIKEGDAALDRADVAAEKSVQLKIAAGKIYAEARDMCFKAGVAWSEKCKEITSRSYSQIKKVLQIANAPDPYAEEQRQRETNTEGHRKARSEQKRSDVRATSQSEEVDPCGVMAEWLAPPHEVDHVEAIMARVKQLSTRDFNRLLDAVVREAKILGLM